MVVSYSAVTIGYRPVPQQAPSAIAMTTSVLYGGVYSYRVIDQPGGPCWVFVKEARLVRQMRLGTPVTGAGLRASSGLAGFWQELG